MAGPKSSGYGVLLTNLSQNKQAPKWSFAGRSGSMSRRFSMPFLNASERRPSTPGPGAYSNQSAKRTPSFGFGSSGREGLGSFCASPGPGAYGGQARTRWLQLKQWDFFKDLS